MEYREWSLAKSCALTDLPSLSSWLEECRAAKSYDIRAVNLLGLGTAFRIRRRSCWGEGCCQACLLVLLFRARETTDVTMMITAIFFSVQGHL